MTYQDRELIALGRTIRQLRTERNITESELATAAGLTLGRLATIEAGRFNLRLDVLLALAHGLNVEPSDLVDHAHAKATAGPIETVSAKQSGPYRADAPILRPPCR